MDLANTYIMDTFFSFNRFYEDLMLQTDKDIVTIYPGGVLDIVKFDNTLEGLYKCLATTAADFLEHEFRLTVAEPCNLCRYFEMLYTI